VNFLRDNVQIKVEERKKKTCANWMESTYRRYLERLAPLRLITKHQRKLFLPTRRGNYFLIVIDIN